MQDKNASEGIYVLENDAELKGFDKVEGRKTFYRYVMAIPILMQYYKHHIPLDAAFGPST